MNEKQFTQLLNKLEDSSWQKILDGQALLMIDDLRLGTGEITDSYVIIKSLHEINDIAHLKQDTIQNAAKILSNYYVIHPLTKTGFNAQVERHIAQKGAQSFAAISGKLPAFTLFVDEGEVIAESPASPRFRYGAFCELEPSIVDSVIESFVNNWVQHGEAYELYLNMNVCRYNC